MVPGYQVSTDRYQGADRTGLVRDFHNSILRYINPEQDQKSPARFSARSPSNPNFKAVNVVDECPPSYDEIFKVVGNRKGNRNSHSQAVPR